jgi:thiol-disulfide isomerase/thioredoxin
MPDQKYFEFIHNGEPVKIETKAPNFIQTMKVKKSNENKLFLDYITHMKESRKKASELQAEKSNLGEEETKKYKKLGKEINSIGDEVLTYQQNLVKDNPNTLVAPIVKMSTDIQIPDAPKNEDGEIIDKAFAYKYYRDHYFDNIDLTDDRLVNTPILHNKIKYYYSDKMLLQQPDSIMKYLFPIMDKVPAGSQMYRFFVTKTTSHFEQSKIMGMDKVMNHLISRYYCAKDENGEKKGFWMKKKKMDELCDKTVKRLKLMVGEVPPNLILPDSTNEKWYNLHELEADYKILYFWDPNCGHCKKVTPKLEKLYAQKLKDRNVEIFAVGKATGDDFEDWKKFIRENNLNFINVGLTRKIYQQAKNDAKSLIPSKTTLESINYQSTYDIFSTPRVWVLDKDNKIIAKSLNVAQIERLMDRLQDHKDTEKIFELGEATEDIK